MFEAYKIGITLSLTNHVSRGLLLLAGDFAKTEAQAAALQKRVQGIQNMALKGGLFLGAGVGMLALFKGPLEEAKKFEQQMGKFKLFGMTDVQNNEALKFAKNMNIMGSSARENLKLMTEAQGVFRESGMKGSHALDGAKTAAPYLAKIAFASGTFDEETAAKMRTASMSMLRYIEMSGGLQSPQKFNELANAGWKLTQTSGGAVNFEQLRQFKARAAIAGQYTTEEGMAMLEPLIAELKGSTAGFATRTAFNRLNGIIKIPNQAAHALMKSGIWDAAKVTLNSQGGIKSFKGNPLKDSALMMQSPVEFYEKNFKPMYDKANMSPEERGRNNAMYFGSTGGLLYTLIDKQLTTIHHSLDSYRKAKGIDESYGMAGKTLAGKEIDLHAKWKNLMLELGLSVLPLAVKALETLIPMVKSLAGWMDRNHGAVKLLASAFVVLAGGLMVRGSVLLLGAAFKGLGLAMAMGSVGGIAGSIFGIGGAIAGVGGLVPGLLALGLAVGGIIALLKFLGPEQKDDGKDHTGEHWKSGTGRGGVGGSWQKNSRVVGGSRGTSGILQKYNAETGEWESASAVQPNGRAGGTSAINNTIVMPNGDVLAKVVTEVQTRGTSSPMRGTGRFDQTRAPLSPGMNVR